MHPIMARSHGRRPYLLACLVVALAAAGARAQTVLTEPKPSGENATTGALAVPDVWIACGKTTPCEDPAACCAIWGMCGYTERFCGDFCLSGACLNKPPGAPGPGPALPPSPVPVPSPPSPLPSPSPPPPLQPSPPPPSPPSPPPVVLVSPSPPPPPPSPPPPTHIDDVTSAREGDIALAACSFPGWVIAHVEDAIYGSVALKCNSTSSYKVVSAACVRQPACLVPAVNAVFDDPCPGAAKALAFGFRCVPESSLPPAPPEPIPSPPPPPRRNPFDVPGGDKDPSPAAQAPDTQPAATPTPAPEPTPEKAAPENPFGGPEKQPGIEPTASPAATAPAPAPAPEPSPAPPPPLPSPSPPPPSPAPPSPSPPSPPPPSPPPPVVIPEIPAPPNAVFSPLWGRNGELYSHASALSDWSQAGYAANAEPIPDYPVKMDVRNFGAKADGSDDSAAFLAAVANATAEAEVSGKGVAVLVPPGDYRLTKKITISSSRVVLRGAGANATRLQYPYPLSQTFGTGEVWAFGGAWLTIQGSNPSSQDTRNYLASLTADARQGDRRLIVDGTEGIKEGQWVRLFATEPDAATERDDGRYKGTRKLQQDEPQAKKDDKAQQKKGGSDAAAVETAEPTVVERLFQKREYQEGLAAAFDAEVKLQTAAATTRPDRVAAQWAKPNATNPGNMDPELVMAGKYATLALLTDPATDKEGKEEAPAAAADGTLDAYLYGNTPVESKRGDESFPAADHMRFVARVVTLGPNWVELDRAVPYDIRLGWKPVVHAFEPSVQHSGFEGFSVEFPWTPYTDHLAVEGYNAIALYEVANCWVRNVRTINADNGVLVNGADFVSVQGATAEFTKPRGEGAAEGRDGHHGLWIQQSSNVAVTDFDIRGRFFHDLSLAIFAESCVYANGTGADLSIDSRRGGTHHNLLSNIDLGVGIRAFRAGGDKHSGANVTWWNVRAAEGELVLPSCHFGDLLFFAGRVTRQLRPAGGESPAVVGAPAPEAPPALDAEQEEEAAPAPAPAAAESRRRLRQEAAARRLQQAEEEEEEGGVETPLTTVRRWCARQKWRVEQVEQGKQLWPVDIYSAQVARRQAGVPV